MEVEGDVDSVGVLIYANIGKFQSSGLDDILKVHLMKRFTTSCPMYGGKQTDLKHCLLLCNHCDKIDFEKFKGIVCKYKG